MPWRRGTLLGSWQHATPGHLHSHLRSRLRFSTHTFEQASPTPEVPSSHPPSTGPSLCSLAINTPALVRVESISLPCCKSLKQSCPCCFSKCQSFFSLLLVSCWPGLSCHRKSRRLHTGKVCSLGLGGRGLVSPVNQTQFRLLTLRLQALAVLSSHMVPAAYPAH